MAYIAKLIIQCKSIIYVLFSLIGTFFIPIVPLVAVVTLLALFDWVVKIYCILKTEGWDGIHSDKMQHTFFKIIIYALFVALLHVIDIFFIKPALGDIIPLVFAESTAILVSKVKLAAFGCLMILMREVKSIDENLEMGFGFSPIKIATNNFSFLFKWKK